MALQHEDRVAACNEFENQLTELSVAIGRQRLEIDFAQLGVPSVGLAGGSTAFYRLTIGDS